MLTTYRRISGAALDCVIVAAVVLAAVGYAILSVGKLAVCSAIMLADRLATRPAKLRVTITAPGS